jgi:hypothetical protein
MELSIPLDHAADPRTAADRAAALSLCGTKSYVHERVAAFREAGVTMLNVIPVGPEPARLVETVRSRL